MQRQYAQERLDRNHNRAYARCPPSARSTSAVGAAPIRAPESLGFRRRQNHTPPIAPHDFRFFPPGRSIIAIDISAKMLERAAKKAAAYQGTIELRLMDVCGLQFS